MKAKTIFNTNLIYFIILTLFVGVRICSALKLFSFLGSGSNLVLTFVVQVGLLLLLPLLLSSKLNKQRTSQTLKDFNVRGVNFKTILISVLIGCIVFVLTVAISSFFSFILSWFGYSPSTGSGNVVDPSWINFAISMLTVAILPAICEEFTHRGMLISGYKTLGLKKAIVYSSLLFGFLHLNVDQFFYATLIGIVLGIVAVFSKSIIPAIIVHFMNNAINVYLDFARAKGLPGGDLMQRVSEYLSTGNPFLTILLCVIILSLLFILLVYLIITLLNINAKRALKNYAEQAAIEQMRNQVLGDASSPVESPPIILSRNQLLNTIKVNIPYEVLGFYITPQVAPSLLDNVFFYASILLSGLITIFTFIWGIL